jgi:hypothetical protein
VNPTAIIVPIAIVGGIVLLIILMIIIAKCTDRTCGDVCCCIFCCSCHTYSKTEEVHVVEEHIEEVYYSDDNGDNEIEEVGGLDDDMNSQKNNVGYNMQYG